MNVNSTTSAALAYASNNPKVNVNRQESAEPTKGPDNDNDRDDTVSQSQRAASTVNFSGQTIGNNLSVSA